MGGKMTKSFDDYFNENFENGLSEPSKYILRFTYEAGQQSKQAEVDELQKRIGEAVELMTMLNDDNTVRFMKKPMLKILKGNTNDH